MTAAPAPTTAAPAPAPQKPVFAPPVLVKEGIKVPESVLYDVETDVYLVSNVNGAPLDTDNNGFISKVGPDGKVVELKWIEGGKKGVTLNAPKGSAISGDTLYVSDITFVRLFDKKSGEPKGKIGVVGATFLNDIAVAPDGTIYVSDTGWKAGKEGFEPTGSDAIFMIGKRGAAEKMIADKALGNPNGLLADDTGVWVAAASGELFHVTKDGKKEKAQKLPAMGLDGLVRLADGSLLTSSWATSSVYRGVPGGTFDVLLTELKSPADIGLDSKRNALLVPIFQGDTVVIQPLPALPPLAAAPAAAPAPTAPATPAASPAPTTPAAPAKPAPAAAPPGKAAPPAASTPPLTSAAPKSPGAAAPAAPATTPKTPAPAPAKPAAPPPAAPTAKAAPPAPPAPAKPAAPPPAAPTAKAAPPAPPAPAKP